MKSMWLSSKCADLKDHRRTDLLKKPLRYILLTRRGRSDGVVDRLDFSSRIAALATT